MIGARLVPLAMIFDPRVIASEPEPFAEGVLAMTVPFLTLWAIYLGFHAQGLWGSKQADAMLAYRRRHRAVVRWAFPIWLYVSVTGVVVDAMLYHLWPSADL